MEKRRDQCKQKTIKENRFLWNALLKDQDITLIELRRLSAKDLIIFFRNITKGRLLTRKRFNDLKSIMNGILYLAVENGVIEHNCLRDIKLDFYLILRIGELKGLRWDDISGDYLHIQRFINDKNEIIENVKGHASEGKRFMPLTQKARYILAQIHILNPDSEYVFIRSGQPLVTATFNRHLKKCCEALGIEYRSSHKLRFSTASIMYKNGVEDTELQRLLGHTSLTMTHHYLRNITSQDETTSKMRAILD